MTATANWATAMLALLFVPLVKVSAENSAAMPAGQINWAINAAPPFHIVQGDYKQQGLCDELINAVQRYLPELKAKREVLPQPRIGRALERSENLCFPCMIHKAQGEQGAVYSQPTHVYPPHQIISHKKAAEQIKQQYPQPVSLADENFNFGYPAGRRYGVLQPFIAGMDNRPGNRLVRSGDNGPVAILQMISSGRLDYTVDYSIIKRYYELTTGEQLALLPIAENHQQPVLGAIGCSNNAWGQSVIEQINRVMPQIRTDEALQQSLNFWFDSKSYTRFNQQHLPPIKP